jgi:hypothetical protein
LAKVAAVAIDEPQIAPKPAQPTHQDEERHHRQRVVAPGLVDLGLHRGERRAPAPVAHVGVADHADDAHGKRDRDAHEREQHHGDEADQRFCQGRRTL